MQLSLFEIPVKKLPYKMRKEDLFKAYFDCRRNKRNANTSLEFELNYESNLLSLYEEIVNDQYRPGPSSCFIIKKPLQREVFAAGFSDRVVHHLLYNYLAPIFEKTFINDSYSCRKGKGTHYGISRADHFIRSCSNNYSSNGYILKLDIKGYFMSIDRVLLFNLIKTKLFKNEKKLRFDVDLILNLLGKVIFNDPVQNCIIKGKKSDWDGLPPSKSLFHAPHGKGLPIGNLTSQLFGNIYLNQLDHFIKRDLGIRYYGRYVDDFVLIHKNIEYLKRLIPIIKEYLKEHLMLELHPDKIYLQSFSHGVKYLGAVIKPHRIYIANRTKINFQQAIVKQNKSLKEPSPSETGKKEFRAVINSYLGMMKHYKTYKLRKEIMEKYPDAFWKRYAYANRDYGKIILKK